MTKKYSYKIFGFNVESTFPFLDIPETAGEPQVLISYGKVPQALAENRVKGLWFEANADEFLFMVYNVAGYYVAHGDTIVIAPEKGASEAEIMLYLMGSAMGALLFQRNLLPLHGSAIKVGNHGAVFLGDSGIGKSTLAGALQKQGYPLLADDICAITISENGKALIIPGFPRLKLWADTLMQFAEDRQGLNRVHQDESFEKYFYPAQNIATEPVVVGSIFVLQSHDKDEFEIISLMGIEKIEPLLKNTFRPEYLEGFGNIKDHFKQCTAVAARSRAWRITRPQKGFLLKELIAQIERFW